MWKKALFVGLLLGVIVFIVGYGEILLFNLAIRSLLVVSATMITLIAADKAIEIFVQPQTTSSEPEQVENVDLENIKSDSNNEASSEASDSQSTDDLNSGDSQIDDDAEIEELADMVSDTMKEDTQDET